MLDLGWPEQGSLAGVTVDIGGMPRNQTASDYLRAIMRNPRGFARLNEYRWKVKEHVIARTLSGPALVALNGRRAIFLEVGLQAPTGTPARIATYDVPSGKRLCEIDYGAAVAQWSQLAPILRQAAESFTLLSQ